MLHLSLGSEDIVILIPVNTECLRLCCATSEIVVTDAGTCNPACQYWVGELLP
jgi:hypothetical protein